MRGTKALREAKNRRDMKRSLKGKAGERGDDEGAVDCLYRIIDERDQALLILGLDRLRHFREGRLHA